MVPNSEFTETLSWMIADIGATILLLSAAFIALLIINPSIIIRIISYMAIAAISITSLSLLIAFIRMIITLTRMRSRKNGNNTYRR